MPLKKGSGRSAVSSNIKTLVGEWEKDGSIGTSHPLTKKKAIRQAVAIALAKAGKSRKSINLGTVLDFVTLPASVEIWTGLRDIHRIQWPCNIGLPGNVSRPNRDWVTRSVGRLGMDHKKLNLFYFLNV